METVQRRAPTRLATSLVTMIGGVAVLGGLMHAVVLVSGHVLISDDPLRRARITHLPYLDHAQYADGATIFLTDLPLWMRLVFAVPGILLTAIYLVSMLSVRRVVREIGRGNPFTSSVRRALAQLTVALLGGTGLHMVVSGVVVSTMPSQVSEHLEETGHRWDGIGFSGPDWPIMLLVLGAIASALLVAFADGARLHEETVGVV